MKGDAMLAFSTSTDKRARKLEISYDEQLLINKLIWGTVRSRHDLAQETGFSKTKLNTLINNLILNGLVSEGEVQPSVGGRRPVGIEIDPNFGLILGIELGVTSIDVCLSYSNLKEITRVSQAISIHQGPKLITKLIEKLIDEVLKTTLDARKRLLAIGIGLPARVVFPSGIMLNSPLMRGWEGFSFQDHFQSLGFDIPVFIDNDVNLMAIGELLAQRTKQYLSNRMNENLIVLKLGTGIGASIVVNGRVLRSEGNAGDLGHTMVDPEGSRCQCGNIGCLEAVAGVPAVLKAIAETIPNKDLSEFTTYDAMLAIKSGNEAASEIVQQAGNRIGQVLAGAVNLLNPSQIVIGGGLISLGPKLIASIKQSIFAHSSPYSTRLLRIEPLSLGERSGLVGARTLALTQIINLGET